jgi:hypothetical protein
MPYFTTPLDDPTEEVGLSVFVAREKRTYRSRWIFEGSQATLAGSKRDICSDTLFLLNTPLGRTNCSQVL